MTYTVLQQPTPLARSAHINRQLEQGDLSPDQVKDYEYFLEEVNHKFLQHSIILHNAYTHWFSLGIASDLELRHFIRQFSVFSNQFLVAALQKVINSPSLTQSRASREILLNELGVIYRNPSASHPATSGSKAGSKSGRKAGSKTDKDREGDPDLVSTEGTVDGGICRFRAAHFEWLLGVAKEFGLGFADIGQRKHGRPSTLYFCNELIRLYGSDDPNIAEGASFAVENWAAAGFWQELEDGLTQIKKQWHPNLPLAFFSWHNRVEAQHATHTLEELETVYFQPEFDRQKFILGGQEILEAIAAFWKGLNADRLAQVYA